MLKSCTFMFKEVECVWLWVQHLQIWKVDDVSFCACDKLLYNGGNKITMNWRIIEATYAQTRIMHEWDYKYKGLVHNEHIFRELWGNV